MSTHQSARAPESLDGYLRTAIRAAREAARIQLAERESDLDIQFKSSDIDLVTRVDALCEESIRRIVAETYPGHVVIGEELGHTAEGRSRWIVDPLDGTVNYAHGFPCYCVSIGVEIDGVIVVGVVYDPERDELFTAVKGRGAFLNGRPLSVSATVRPRAALLATGFAYVEERINLNLEVFARVLPKVQSIRRPGAAALDICYVAAGRLDGFWELGLNPWDVAAGWLVVQEAGGTVTGTGGAPYRLGDPVLVASNGHLHAALLDVLQLDTVVV
ncbi:MAG TPA: inositol monophosphatase family protein [Trueperaceae bacterium]|nr:inositol monophosphatase family protein [Trueperaceae bacterium]